MLFFWNPPARKNQPAPVFEHIKRLDPLGTFFFIPAVVCLLLALQWGGSTYDWNSWRIIVLFVVFGVLLIAFATVQILTPDTASIPVRIITQRSVILATSFTFFIAGSMLMLVYYLPIWCKFSLSLPVLASANSCPQSKPSRRLALSSRASTRCHWFWLSWHPASLTASPPRKLATMSRP